MPSQNGGLRRRSFKKRGWWVGECLDNPEVARAFFATSSAQQTLVIIVGIFLFYMCIPAYIINPTAGSAVLLVATSIFCVGLVFDVKLILDQQVGSVVLLEAKCGCVHDETDMSRSPDT